MDYENRPVPEVNVSPDHPLQEFAWLLAAAGLLLAVALLLFYLLAGWLLRFVPFELEQELAEEVLTYRPLAAPADACGQARAAYLQTLAAEVVAVMDFPPALRAVVHYRDADTVNAFATLGGHVFIYRGLFDRLHSENALAMLLAHELAHVRHRDPLQALGRGVTTALALSVLLGGTGSDTAWRLASGAHQLTALGFSRRQERAADAAALAALQRRYGHGGGAADLFRALAAAQGERAEPPALFSTHPGLGERLQAMAVHEGAQPLRPLPAAVLCRSE